MPNQMSSFSTSQPTPLSSRWHFIRNALLIVALVIMTGHVLIYLAFGASLIPFPFDYDQGEGFELNTTILLAQGQCPYCDNNTFPFYTSNYTPFFHILMVPFMWLFGADYWYGRLIIFGATLLTACLIAWAIQRETRQRPIALLAGMAFLASNYIYHNAPLLRQHLFMVMLETLAVVILAAAFDNTGKNRHKSLFIGFLILLCAGYTKQLAAYTCIAVAIWLILRQPRLILLYGSGLAVAAAAIFAVALLLTDGNWWVNIIASNQNAYQTEQFVGLLRQFLRLHWALILPASLLILYELYFARLSLYTIWFIVSFIATIGAGKWGAGDSYFATTIASLCILAGIFTARCWNQAWVFPKNYLTRRFSASISPSLWAFISVISLALWLIYGSTVIKFPTSGAIFEPLAKLLNITPAPGHRYPLYDAAGWTVGYAVTGHFVSEEDYLNGWAIVERVRNAPGHILSEDAGFAIQAGRIVVNNTTQLRNLWESGHFDPAAMIQMIKNHEFGLIIRRADFYPPPVLDAINAYYRKDTIIPMNGFEYQLWIPR
jgi:hypothetical protein